MILVYDILAKASFQELDNWIEEARRYTSIDVPILLIGNKTDRITEREVSKDDAQVCRQVHSRNHLRLRHKLPKFTCTLKSRL